MGGGLIDLFGGRRDLSARMIRGVGESSLRFREDPLRILRAARFASKLEFEVEAETRAAMTREVGRIEILLPERLADETTKLLVTARPSLGLDVLREVGALASYLPEVADLAGIADSGPHHAYDVWPHTLKVVEGVSYIAELRWAALLHDIGKVSTAKIGVEGHVRFLGHEDVSASLADGIMHRLRFPNVFRKAVVSLVANHMRPHAYDESWRDGAVRRMEGDAGDYFPWLIELARARCRRAQTETSIWRSTTV